MSMVGGSHSANIRGNWKCSKHCLVRIFAPFFLFFMGGGQGRPNIFLWRPFYSWRSPNSNFYFKEELEALLSLPPLLTSLVLQQRDFWELGLFSTQCHWISRKLWIMIQMLNCLSTRRSERCLYHSEQETIYCASLVVNLKKKPSKFTFLDLNSLIKNEKKKNKGNTF